MAPHTHSVLIPNRGVIALDIIDSLKSIGLHTILHHSPEDAGSLAVRLADENHRFYSSKLSDSYLDDEAIIEKALERGVDFIHPGYGFYSEDPDFTKRCEENSIKTIGPDSKTLRAIQNKITLRREVSRVGIPVLESSQVITSPLDYHDQGQKIPFPQLIKPVAGTGGKGIRLVLSEREASGIINQQLKREEFQRYGLFIEPFLGDAHLIEIPFIRDKQGNILVLPEIEASVQRRFQKIFQESPSPNLKQDMRDQLISYTRKIAEMLDYIGLGSAEFFVWDGQAVFSELNPSLQINTLISEIHTNSNFIKKQFAISNGETLNQVQGFKVISPKHHVVLVSLMAENPYDHFQPSAGTVEDFSYYASFRTLFKTSIYTGNRISSLYDPFIGKIATFSSRRETSLQTLRHFLDNITLRGIHTNLVFLRHLLENPLLVKGQTCIDFLNRHCQFASKPHNESAQSIAAVLLAAEFHMENRQKNYKAQLERMKQPGFFKRLFSGL
jgi:acetyl/propionyl-CoA carboxylase alpha subunit